MSEEKKDYLVCDDDDNSEDYKITPQFQKSLSWPRRRSRSEPRCMKIERRRLLFEDYFRVEKDTKILLPGVPRQDDDWARDTHDFFNLVILIPIVVLNIMNWNWEQMLSNKRKKPIESTWTGDYFMEFWKVTMFYFIVDLLWVCIIPRCVKSPTTIIQHHIVTIIYLTVPYLYPQCQWCMGACLSVEINTWFLIARRVLNTMGLSPWTIDLPFLFSVRLKLISFFFYVTWVAIRCILYPILLIPFWEISVQESLRQGTWIHLPSLICPIHSVFCVLNAKWTYDLFMSKLRQMKRKGRENHANKFL
uniref:TLC domain-containing protein n=1 Tax=Eucampia antarctica TaxID=49252 RepID=A0A7S2S862_9STRA|mmetsp:Transcript_3747/g.3527  ORF Transcript_3747/g.3527 Transcript_3747/m.3527 type:complete len:305 (+) Transcript_3747:235-1149(+)